MIQLANASHIQSPGLQLAVPADVPLSHLGNRRRGIARGALVSGKSMSCVEAESTGCIRELPGAEVHYK